MNDVTQSATTAPAAIVPETKPSTEATAIPAIHKRVIPPAQAKPKASQEAAPDMIKSSYFGSWTDEALDAIAASGKPLLEDGNIAVVTADGTIKSEPNRISHHLPTEGLVGSHYSVKVLPRRNYRGSVDRVWLRGETKYGRSKVRAGKLEVLIKQGCPNFIAKHAVVLPSGMDRAIWCFSTVLLTHPELLGMSFESRQAILNAIPADVPVNRQFVLNCTQDRLGDAFLLAENVIARYTRNGALKLPPIKVIADPAPAMLPKSGTIRGASDFSGL